MSIFYFSVRKCVGEMGTLDVRQEIESAERYFEECRRYGQGVGTKEGARYRQCLTYRNTLEAKIEEIQSKGELICYEFTKHPLNNASYWRYGVYRYQGRVYIIENVPDGDETCAILKLVGY